ncbi:hypothetical protein RC74_19140 [Falsihalocynthiibacter arcticus]|uniref:Uncharacterized protein n=1 Tax=Falsihalocynthiibacter arcticus TaxID=1579316 RepID=A0A126V5V5_9RHOB|nr:hypothetical protein RC74_19140 [Falsihalocynthiibacter arcticus]
MVRYSVGLDSVTLCGAIIDVLRPSRRECEEAYIKGKLFVADLMHKASFMVCDIEGRKTYDREVGVCYFIMEDVQKILAKHYAIRRHHPLSSHLSCLRLRSGLSPLYRLLQREKTSAFVQVSVTVFKGRIWVRIFSAKIYRARSQSWLVAFDQRRTVLCLHCVRGM